MRQPPALNEVINGLPRRRQILGRSGDVQEAVIAALTQQVGNVRRERVKLRGRKRGGEREPV